MSNAYSIKQPDSPARKIIEHTLRIAFGVTKAYKHNMRPMTKNDSNTTMLLSLLLAADTPATPDIGTLQTLIVNLVEKIEMGVTKYAPEALKLILLTYKISAIVRIIVTGTTFAVMTLIGFRLLPWALRHLDHWSHQPKEYMASTVEVSAATALPIFGILYLSFTIWFLSTWLNAWDWIAATHPELALVHDLIRKVLGGY